MNKQFLTISLCSFGLALGVLATTLVMVSNNEDKAQVGHADVVTYNIEYSSTVGNYPTSAESGLEAKSRETTLHFENFVANTNNKYVTSNEAAEHYLYNVQPISGVTKVEVQASGNDVYLAASYNKLTLNDFKGNNRKDMLLFSSIGSGSLITLNTSEVTPLANCRYFLIYANSSDISLDLFKVTYTCSSSGQTDPGVDTQTSFKTNEIAGMESIYGSGNTIPFFNTSAYVVDEPTETSFSLTIPAATEALSTAYHTVLVNASFDTFINPSSGTRVYQKVLGEKAMLLYYTYTPGVVSTSGVMKVVSMYNNPLNHSTSWPTEAVATFFTGTTISFPALTGASDYFWNSNSTTKQIGFSLGGVTPTIKDSIISTLTGAGFVLSSFGTDSYINYATSSMVSSLQYDETNSSLGFMLESSGSIRTSFPQSELNANFTDYEVNGNKYSQSFANYESSNAKFKYTYYVETATNYPYVKIEVANSSETEIKNFISSMSKAPYTNILDFDSSSQRSNYLYLVGNNNYFHATYDFENSIYKIIYSITTDSNKYQEMSSWSTLLSTLVEANVIQSKNNYIQYEGTNFKYFYSEYSRKVIICGTSKAELETYAASLNNAEGTFKSIYNYTDMQYVSQINQAEEGSTQYDTEKINTDFIDNGYISIYLSYTNELPVTSKTWLSDYIDSSIEITSIEKSSTLFPSVTNEDSSRTFFGSKSLEGTNEAILITVSGAASTDLENYKNNLISDSYNFHYDEYYQSYINGTNNIRARIVTYEDDATTFSVSLSANALYVNPTTSWPTSAELVASSINQMVANELVSCPLTIDGASYYTAARGNNTEIESLKGTSGTLIVDIFKADTEMTQEKIEKINSDYQEKMTEAGYDGANKSITITIDSVEYKIDLECKVTYNILKTGSTTTGYNFRVNITFNRSSK